MGEDSFTVKHLNLHAFPKMVSAKTPTCKATITPATASTSTPLHANARLDHCKQHQTPSNNKHQGNTRKHQETASSSAAASTTNHVSSRTVGALDIYGAAMQYAYSPNPRMRVCHECCHELGHGVDDWASQARECEEGPHCCCTRVQPFSLH